MWLCPVIMVVVGEACYKREPVMSCLEKDGCDAALPDRCSYVETVILVICRLQQPSRGIIFVLVSGEAQTLCQALSRLISYLPPRFLCNVCKVRSLRLLVCRLPGRSLGRSCRCTRLSTQGAYADGSSGVASPPGRAQASAESSLRTIPCLLIYSAGGAIRSLACMSTVCLHTVLHSDTRAHQLRASKH